MLKQESLNMLKIQPLAAICIISATKTKPTGEYFGMFLFFIKQSSGVKNLNLTLAIDML